MPAPRNQKHRPANPRGKTPAAKKRTHSGPKPLRNVADRLVLENIEQILPGNALLVLSKGTGVAKRLIAGKPDVSWNVFTFEHFFLRSVYESLTAEDDHQDPDVELFCLPDLPEAQFDTIVFPTDSRASSELTRDLLQQIRHRMKDTSRLIVSTDNPKDHWLHVHLKSTFGKVTVLRSKDGVCYVCRPGTAAVKEKNFEAEFAFRDGERLIKCVSRPGVFSHRRIDAGARALIRSLELLDDDPEFANAPPERIVEMGCGCGSVSVATALRYPNAEILAVDSHARAVQSTERTAAANGVTNISVLLTSDGEVPNAADWDLFLCNPPYYSDFRISELFLQSASESLRPGGRLHVVTKLTDWHQNRMIELFANADVHRYGEYDVVVSEI